MSGIWYKDNNSTDTCFYENLSVATQSSVTSEHLDAWVSEFLGKKITAGHSMLVQVINCPLYLRLIYADGTVKRIQLDLGG